jgi:hypothetical protein
MQTSKSFWSLSLNRLFGASRPKNGRKRRAGTSSSRRRSFEHLERREVLSATLGSALTIGNGLQNSSALDVATDSAGYSYVSGMFAGTVDFDLNNIHEGDADIITARGAGDAYVAKYAPDDSLVWVQRMGGENSMSVESGGELAVDSGGAAYVAGAFYGSADFGATTLTSVGDSDKFVAKLDASGNVQWVTQWDTTAAYRGMDVDGAGNVYVLSSRVGDAYEIRKFSSGGNALWSHTIVNRSNLTSADLAVNAAGTVFVAGSFDGTVDFDPSAKTKYVSSGSARSAFVLKLDTNGKFGWVSPFIGKTVGSTRSASGNTSITLDGSGNIIVGGTFNGTVDFNPGSGTTYLATPNGGFITKLNNSGALVCPREIEGDAGVFVRGLDVDAFGNIYAAGTFNGTVDLNPGAGVYSRTTAGTSDIFVMKLTSAGNFVWAETFGGSGSHLSWGMAVDAGGDVHVGGNYSDPFDVDPDPLAIELLPGDGAFARGFKLRLQQA